MAGEAAGKFDCNCTRYRRGPLKFWSDNPTRMTNSVSAPAPVTAVLLAAGASKRMGAVKQLLDLGGKTLLETVLDNLRRSQVSEIVVVLGSSADEIRERVRLHGVRVVVNQYYEQGMGTSVRAGIAAVDVRADAALVILADQPFVRPDTLDLIIETYRERKPHIVIPTYKGFRGNPILIDRSLFPELLNLAGDIGCRAIFGSHTEDLLKVAVDDIGVLLDIDTPEDLERFRQLHAAGSLEPHLLETVDLQGRGDRPELVIVGNDEVAKALAQFGHMLDFTVTIIDPLLDLPDIPGATRILRVLDLARVGSDAGTYVVIASRGRFDEEAVEQALNANAPYVALMANPKRAREIAASLQRNGLSNEQLKRLRAPAGLPIGAKTPAEIALSLMAEIVSERSKPHHIP